MIKLSTREILKILRLYGRADDNTGLKDIRRAHFTHYEDVVKAEFLCKKTEYVLFFGAHAEAFVEEGEDNQDVIALKNPLDETTIATPFNGKQVVLFERPSRKVRLDVFLSQSFDTSISRSLWQKYIKSGAVSVNGIIISSPKTEVFSTDTIHVRLPENKTQTQVIPVLYEDEDVMVVNKPAGVLTHAKGGISQEYTVADAFRDKTTFGEETDRPGVVHRLDRDTSGVLIGARTPEAAQYLQRQFANRTVRKEYIALVVGTLKHQMAHINVPIARNPKKPSTFRVDAKGKSAFTTYEVLAVNDTLSLVRLLPKTGRTHQLRVHMAHIGHPILGDTVYGSKAERLFLHARALTITLPSGKTQTFSADAPELFWNYIDKPEVLNASE